MPFGGILSAGIGAATSLGSGIAGSKKASKAGNQLNQAATGIANNITRQAGVGATGVSQAAAAGATGVSQAAAGAGAQVSNAAGTAQQTVNNGTSNANSLLAGVFGTQSANLNPYLNVGTQSTNQLAAALAPGGSLTSQFSFDPTQVANNPDYQFQLQQGTQAVQRQAAAMGQNVGGGTLKALTQYSQGLASTSMNEYYNQALNTFQTNRNNTLQSIMAGVNTGQVGTAQYNAAAQNYGNQAASNTLNSAIYNGNIGYNAANYGANAGLNAGYFGANSANQAAQFGANLNQQAAENAGNFLMQGAQGQAVGTLGANNSLWNGITGGIGGMMNGFTQYYNQQNANNNNMTFPASSGVGTLDQGIAGMPNSTVPITYPFWGGA